MISIHPVRITIVLLVSLLLSRASGEVIELSNDTFEHLTQASTGQTTGKWMVKFYATWCGHCKKLEPVWVALDTELKENHSEFGINVANVDAIKNYDLAKRFHVQGYPLLLYFAQGRMYRYQGSRDLESLVEFVTEGYKKDNGDAVPPPPGWVEVYRKKLIKFIHSKPHLSMLSDDFEHIIALRKNAALLLLFIGVFFGTMIGYILGTLGGGTTKVKAKKD